MDVLILRDPRESKKKCSLTPLQGRPGIRFVEYHPERVLAAGPRLWLHPDGELLDPSDAELGRGLLLVDCAWRRVPSLVRTVEGDLLPRRLPPLSTAYPRRSRVFEDPSAGLASVEALFAACRILGWPGEDLLDEYRWGDEFLSANAERLGPAPPGARDARGG